MKRKVKFQEGGEVSMSAAERRRANIERLNARRSERASQAQVQRDIAEFNRQLGRGDVSPELARRLGATSDVAEFNRRLQSGQMDADTMRRMGGTPSGPADFDVNSRGEARSMSQGRDLAPRSEGRMTLNPPQGSAVALRDGAGMAPSGGGSVLSRMAPRAGGILGLLGLAPLAVDAYRSVRDRPRSQDDLDVMEAYRTGRDVREIQAQRAAREGRGVFPGETPETTPTPAPEAAPAQAQARSQPTRRAAAPARRESVTADDLNAMVLRLQSGSPPQTETERRLADRMGIAYRKGGMVKPKKYQEGGAVKVPGKTPAMGGPKPPARMRDRVSAEERKELDAPLTQAEKNRMSASGFKKGGKIVAKKMKTGGKVPAPKKMMKGGITSKPKVKPAKYAKGGMTKGCK